MWYPVVDLRLVAHFFTHRLAILSDYSCYVDDIEAKGKEKGIEERPNPCKYHVYVDSSLRGKPVSIFLTDYVNFVGCHCRLNQGE